MPKNKPAESSESTGKRRRHWLWRIVRVMLILILLTAAGVAGLYYVAGPMFWRWKVRSALANTWDGPIRIGQVDFTLSGPTVFRDVEFLDHQNRVWAHLDTMEFHLRNWPSAKAVLTEIEITGADATVYLDSGCLNIPLQKSKSKPTPTTSPTTSPAQTGNDSSIHLERIILRGVKLNIVQTDRPGHIDENRPDVLKLIRLYGTGSARGDVVITNTGLDGHSDAIAFGQIDFPRVEILDLRKLLQAEELPGVPLKPLVLTHVKSKKIVWESKGWLESSDLYAELGKGSAWCRMKLDFRPKMPVLYDVDFRIRRMPLRMFYDSFNPTQQVSFGRVSAIVDDIRGTGRDLESLTLDGLLFLDDSDLDHVNIIGDVFDKMHVDAEKIKDGSDVRIMFRVADGVVTFDRAQLGNNLTAIMVEPGGTANLLTRELDLTVVGGFFNELAKVPILNLVTSPMKQLARLRVTGNWRNPAIYPDPINNLASGTAAFFGAMLHTGGAMVALPVTAFENAENSSSNPSTDSP